MNSPERAVLEAAVNYVKLWRRNDDGSPDAYEAFNKIIEAVDAWRATRGEK